MVKATPTSTFVMAQAEFTFELFVITFDAPAQFGIIDECGEGRVLGHRLKVHDEGVVGTKPSGRSGIRRDGTKEILGCGSCRPRARNPAAHHERLKNAASKTS